MRFYTPEGQPAHRVPRRERVREGAPVSIRVADDSDYPAMAHIARDAIQNFNFMTPGYKQYYLDIHEDKVFSKDFSRQGPYRGIHTLVAEKKGHVVGFYVTCEGAPDIKDVARRTKTAPAGALSRQFFIAPGEQGHLIGTRLRIEGVRDLMRCGKKTMIGFAFDDNPVRSFYEATGGRRIFGRTNYAYAFPSSHSTPYCEGSYYGYKLDEHLAKLEARLK